jgi:hypothetical protein
MIDEWFATSPFALDHPASTSSDSISAAMVMIHAKKVGTTRSACGLNTLAWHKYWVPFHSATSENHCGVCIAVVAAERGNRVKQGALRIGSLTDS